MFIFNTLEQKSTGRLLSLSLCLNSIPIDRAYDACMLGVPFNLRTKHCIKEVLRFLFAKSNINVRVSILEGLYAIVILILFLFSFMTFIISMYTGTHKREQLWGGEKRKHSHFKTHSVLPATC